MMETNADILAARAKLAQKFESRIGGKGTCRRKVKAKHQGGTVDDKKLQQQLKRLGLNTIPNVEEVNMFREDGSVQHFKDPKVQASIGSNTYLITGANEKKQIQELLPGILMQLGPDNLQQILAQHMAKQGGPPKPPKDDDIPDVEDFEAVSDDKTGSDEK